MSQTEQIAAARHQVIQGEPTEAPDVDTVLCYVPGTLLENPKGDLINGETKAMLLIHPDGTPNDTRKWVRSRGPLAKWALTSGDLTKGTRIIAVGHPAEAPGNSRGTDTRPWMLEADRITVDLWHQSQ